MSTNTSRSRSREIQDRKMKSKESKETTPSPDNNNVEESSFFLPTIKDGVVALGDLWDCRSNQATGNLFKESLAGEHLQADPISCDDYHFFRCKTTKDINSTFGISASLSMDIVLGGGTLKIEGSGSYDSTSSSKFNSECIIVKKETSTYRVGVRASAVEAVSELVAENITSGRIQATHYVSAVILGGKAIGDIKVTENVSNSKMEIKGSFKLGFGEEGKGSFNAEVEAELSKLDTEAYSNYTTTVNLFAQPRMKNTITDCVTMFEEVKKLQTYMEAEKHFPQLKNEKGESYVTGVPISFRLVPLAQLIDFKAEQLYQMIKEDLMNDFTSMLYTLQDFCNPEHIKGLMIEQSESIIPILLDPSNPLTQEVMEFSKGKLKTARDLKQTAASVFAEYKYGKKKVEDLTQVIKRYDEEFDITQVTSQMLIFVSRAKMELNGIRASDVNGLVDENDEPSVRFFSNEIDLEDWYNPERRIKILLFTNYSEGSPSGVFLNLFDMSPTLAKNGVEVGIAFPNISEKFVLKFKTQYGETEFEAPEIRFMLEVLAIAVNEGRNIAKLFYSLNASLSGLNLPMEDYLFDIPNLVTVMKEFHEVIICETYLGLLASLLPINDKDIWNFVLPIQGTKTGIECMRFFRQLRRLIPEKYPKLAYRWLVAQFNNVSEKFDSPVLLIFKNDLLQAICLDRLDVLISMEEIGKKAIPDFSILSFKRMRDSCLYPPRADFAINIGQNLILDHETFNSLPLSNSSFFERNEDKFLLEAIEITQASVMRDEPGILSSVARLAIKDTSSLQTILERHGFEDRGFNRTKWKNGDIKWEELYKELQESISTFSVYLTKVFVALMELKDLPIERELTKLTNIDFEISPSNNSGNTNEMANNRLKDSFHETMDSILQIFLQDNGNKTYIWKNFRINEDLLFDGLRQEILSYDGATLKIRKIGIIKAMETFINDQMETEALFNLTQLIVLVEGLQNEKFKSFKHQIVPVVKKYCGRIQLEDVNEGEISNAGVKYKGAKRRINDSLIERQLFKTLGVLGEISYHPLLYTIHQELYNLVILPAASNTKSLIEKMTQMGGFKEDQESLFESRLELIWTNPKFLYLLRQVLSNEGVLEALYVHVAYISNFKSNKAMALENEEREDLINQDRRELINPEDNDKEVGDGLKVITFPAYIPTDIVEKIKPLIALRSIPTFDWIRDWKDLDTIIEQFQIIVIRKVIPFEFPEALRRNIETNEILKETMKAAGCLFYWNEKDAILEHPWSLGTISLALELLMKARDLNKKEKTLFNLEIDKPKEERNSEKTIEVNEAWRKFLKGGKMKEINYQQFLLLDKLNPIALKEYEELDGSVDTIFRYILQQVKMLNSYILRPIFISRFINYPLPGPKPGQIDFGDGLPNKNLGLLLTRSDIQTALFHLTDPFVSHRLLQSMAQTPIALPLIVTSIEQGEDPESAPIKKGTYKVSKIRLLLPALQNLLIPELESLVSQPRLFKDPFRFLLTLRVGDTKEELGRSSLINHHLMADKNMFSCLYESGKQVGRALNREGLVEFTWLTQTTCEDQFWSNVVKPEYDSQRNETLLLGALHGDALSFPFLFEILKPYISCYVVFWKVGNWTELKAKKKQLQQMMGTGPEVLDIILYPDTTIMTNVHEQNILKQSTLDSQINEVNKAKLQRVFKEAIRIPKTSNYPTLKELDEETRVTSNQNQSNSFLSFAGLGGGPSKGSKPLSTELPIQVELQKELSTKESTQLVQFIENNTIGNIQDAIRKNDIILIKTLFIYLIKIFFLPRDERNASLAHLTSELDYLNRKSSKKYIQRVNKLRQQIEEIYSNNNPDESIVLEIQEEMKISLDQLRLHTMSIQDLFRLMSLHGLVQGDEHLIQCYSEVIQDGFPVEIFHPTYDETPWMHPGKETLLKLPQETRIFIISTFGLKGSGKSMLLNRLFGQGFTEHSSTLGLQMRVLWLTEELREELDCDAFVVLDSEGVGSPENKIDEQAAILERKLITFLLGMSNISLANVLGPSMKELSSILEIAFVALSKFDDLLITPDLYIVGQQDISNPEGSGSAQSNSSNLSIRTILNDGKNISINSIPAESISTEISKSLAEVLKLTSTRGLETGLLIREEYQLYQLKSRNKHGEIIQSISKIGQLNNQNPDYFEYHKDIQRLYQRIIESAFETRQKRLKLGQWTEFTLSFWNQIQTLEIPFNSQIATEIEKTIQFEEKIAQVKRAIDAAFFYHEKKAEADFNNGPPSLNKLFDEYLVGFDEQLNLKFNKLTLTLRKVINNCEDQKVGETFANRKRRINANESGALISPDACLACAQAFYQREALYSQIVGMKRSFLISEDISNYTNDVMDSIYCRIQQSLISRQIYEGKSEEMYTMTNTMNQGNDNDYKWTAFIQYISTLQHVIPARHRLDSELRQVYKTLPHLLARVKPEGSFDFPNLEQIVAFDVQLYNSALESSLNQLKPEKLNWIQHDWLLSRLEDIPRQMAADFETILYRIGMARELQSRIQKLLTLFEEFCGGKCLPKFKWEVHLFGIQLFSRFVDEQQKGWDFSETTDNPVPGNNPLKAIRWRKEQGDDFELLFADTNTNLMDPIKTMQSRW